MRPEGDIAKASPLEGTKAQHSLLHNPLSYLGLLIALLSLIAIIFLLIIEFNTGHAPQYIGILSYLILPGVLVIGLILVPVGMGLENRRRRLLAARGVVEIFPPRFPLIDLNQPRHQKLFLIWSGATILVLMVLGTVTYRGYEFMDSTTFCVTCHQVMRPEYTAYQDSPHARVTCTACHIGPGAEWYVRAKISGLNQVLAMLTNSYPRPIPTPIEQLRPAMETCEQCHWPEKFYGDQLVVRPHFAPDEQNTDRTSTMVIKTGGGSDRVGMSMGIHWHVDEKNQIKYVATDRKRQQIPWVSALGANGETVEYFATDRPIGAEALAEAEPRRMDCIDCHNRPTHVFQKPEQALDQAIATGKIDRTLPSVKKTGLDLLTQTFGSEEEARRRIDEGLAGFYGTKYPEVAATKGESIRQSAATLQGIWAKNVFPEMNITWGTYAGNIGHQETAGCFRCHDGKHVSKEGKVIRQDCDLCHTQPVPLAAGAPGATGQPAAAPPKPAEGGVAGTQKGLHLAAPHSTFACGQCHTMSPTSVAGRETCTTCHQDRVQHNAGPTCNTCHSFRG